MLHIILIIVLILFVLGVIKIAFIGPGKIKPESAYPEAMYHPLKTQKEIDYALEEIKILQKKYGLLHWWQIFNKYDTSYAIKWWKMKIDCADI